MRTCVTHHHACDCREEKFRKMEAALAEARKGLEFYAGMPSQYTNDYSSPVHLDDDGYPVDDNEYFDGNYKRQGKTARTTLSTIDAILSEDEREEEG